MMKIYIYNIKQLKVSIFHPEKSKKYHCTIIITIVMLMQMGIFCNILFVNLYNAK